jgi:hypothetical protein
MRTAIVVASILVLARNAAAETCAEARKAGRVCVISFTDCILTFGEPVKLERSNTPIRRNFGRLIFADCVPTSCVPRRAREDPDAPRLRRADDAQPRRPLASEWDARPN